VDHSLLADGVSPLHAGLSVVIFALSALIGGISGFGFSGLAASTFWVLPSDMVVPLMMALSVANQLVSFMQVREEISPLRDWWPAGPAPYILGGLVGVPVGVEILHILPKTGLLISFGALLTGYSLYSLRKPDSLRITHGGGWRSACLIGALGGMIGGFTAFPGAAVVVWCGLRGMQKSASRAIIQPYIIIMQVVAVSLVALMRPTTFDNRFWLTLPVELPFVVIGSSIGVRLYKKLSNAHYHRITLCMLVVSGVGIGLKGLLALWRP